MCSAYFPSMVATTCPEICNALRKWNPLQRQKYRMSYRGAVTATLRCLRREGCFGIGIGLEEPEESVQTLVPFPFRSDVSRLRILFPMRRQRRIAGPVYRCIYTIDKFMSTLLRPERSMKYAWLYAPRNERSFMN